MVGMEGDREAKREAKRGGSLPVLTLRQVAGLRVTELHIPGLRLLQVLTVAGRPNGTDNLSPPSARAAALGALGSVGVGGGRDRPEAGTPKGRRKGKVAHDTCHITDSACVPTCPRCQSDSNMEEEGTSTH